MERVGRQSYRIEQKEVVIDRTDCQTSQLDAARRCTEMSSQYEGHSEE